MTVIDEETPEGRGTERTTMAIKISETPEIQSNESVAPFARDDLELRAVTTLLAGLNAVDRPEETADEDPHDSMKFLQRFQLRHLIAISSLLARDGEVVACIPKITGPGLEIFITATVSAQVQSSGTDTNPSYSKPTVKLISEDAIKIKDCDDVCTFIVNNWILGFEGHARVVAKLVNDCIEVGAKSSDAWKKLSRYCVAQSSPKLAKCFASKYLNIFIEALHESNREPESALVIPAMSSNDCGYIKVMMKKLRLFKASEYPELTQAFEKTQGNSRQITPAMLPEISLLFRCLMNELCKASHKVAAMRVAPALPSLVAFTKSVKKLWHLLRYLEYLVTYSNFFRWFITEHLEKAIEKASLNHKPEAGDVAKETVNLETIARFREKFSSAVSEPAWEVMKWLRLVTSNIHSACMFYKSQSLGMTAGIDRKIKFKILQMSPPSAGIKDWKEMVKNLYSTDEERERVIKFLDGKTFTNDWKFTGGMHSAAILWCLSTLAISEVSSTTIIPQSVISEFYDVHNLIAPSRQCCPVCVAICHEVNTYAAIPVNAIETHFKITPCTFPQGLPEEARANVLKHFKGVLKTALQDVAKGVESTEADLQDVTKGVESLEVEETKAE